jgi:hypothetical protein
LKRQAKGSEVSTRVDLNAGRIYRTADIQDLSMLVFPSRNATDLRVAFILIWATILESREGKVTSDELDFKRRELAPEISQKTLWKTRAVMSRLGMIVLRDMEYWQFSGRWAGSLDSLAKKSDSMMTKPATRDQMKKVWTLLNYSKALLKERKRPRPLQAEAPSD